MSYRYLTVRYMHKADGNIDEAVRVDNRLRDKDYTSANVILDFKEKKVLKSRLGGEVGSKDWDTVRGYYAEHYADLIKNLEKDSDSESAAIEDDSVQS